ncbi:hypothetical protein CAOG_08285 [Capsaspora owczarzaki ATCC 30864]|uniref:hypothetical protein n=1 Tax=Capsaspora owczarzaki (strain ATCC 30864) TaxID=595528 RepID=UPI0001FE2855|nr:hypothetical protein CAOG_08285 [Capsaspora owczarzaki ATCC 30864]|eukprot:XP_004342004.1 hypothetical protein CAOG_08285 [Capsaspora owczarzaki ATCC 30864]
MPRHDRLPLQLFGLLLICAAMFVASIAEASSSTTIPRLHCRNHKNEDVDFWLYFRSSAVEPYYFFDSINIHTNTVRLVPPQAVFAHDLGADTALAPTLRNHVVWTNEHDLYGFTTFDPTENVFVPHAPPLDPIGLNLARTSNQPFLSALLAVEHSEDSAADTNGFVITTTIPRLLPVDMRTSTLAPEIPSRLWFDPEDTSLSAILCISLNTSTGIDAIVQMALTTNPFVPALELLHGAPPSLHAFAQRMFATAGPAPPIAPGGIFLAAAADACARCLRAPRTIAGAGADCLLTMEVAGSHVPPRSPSPVALGSGVWRALAKNRGFPTELQFAPAHVGASAAGVVALEAMLRRNVWHSPGPVTALVGAGWAAKLVCVGDLFFTNDTMLSGSALCASLPEAFVVAVDEGRFTEMVPSIVASENESLRRRIGEGNGELPPIAPAISDAMQDLDTERLQRKMAEPRKKLNKREAEDEPHENARDLANELRQGLKLLADSQTHLSTFGTANSRLLQCQSNSLAEPDGSRFVFIRWTATTHLEASCLAVTIQVLVGSPNEDPNSMDMAGDASTADDKEADDKEADDTEADDTEADDKVKGKLAARSRRPLPAGSDTNVVVGRLFCRVEPSGFLNVASCSPTPEFLNRPEEHDQYEPPAADAPIKAVKSWRAGGLRSVVVVVQLSRALIEQHEGNGKSLYLRVVEDVHGMRAYCRDTWLNVVSDTKPQFTRCNPSMCLFSLVSTERKRRLLHISGRELQRMWHRWQCTDPAKNCQALISGLSDWDGCDDELQRLLSRAVDPPNDLANEAVESVAGGTARRDANLDARSDAVDVCSVGDALVCIDPKRNATSLRSRRTIDKNSLFLSAYYVCRDFIHGQNDAEQELCLIVQSVGPPDILELVETNPCTEEDDQSYICGSVTFWDQTELKTFVESWYQMLKAGCAARFPPPAQPAPPAPLSRNQEGMLRQHFSEQMMLMQAETENPKEALLQSATPPAAAWFYRHIEKQIAFYSMPQASGSQASGSQTGVSPTFDPSRLVPICVTLLNSTALPAAQQKIQSDSKADQDRTAYVFKDTTSTAHTLSLPEAQPAYLTLYDKAMKMPVFSAYRIPLEKPGKSQSFKSLENGHRHARPDPTNFLHSGELILLPDGSPLAAGLVDIHSEKLLKQDVGTAKNRDFKNSEFDRGHLNPNSINSYVSAKPGVDEDFANAYATFALVNVAPQYERFNRVYWSRAECALRAALYLAARPVQTAAAATPQPAAPPSPRQPANEAFVMTGVALTKAPDVLPKNKEVAIPGWFWTAVCVPNVGTFAFWGENQSLEPKKRTDKYSAVIKVGSVDELLQTLQGPPQATPQAQQATPQAQQASDLFRNCGSTNPGDAEELQTVFENALDDTSICFRREERDMLFELELASEQLWNLPDQLDSKPPSDRELRSKADKADEESPASQPGCAGSSIDSPTADTTARNHLEHLQKISQSDKRKLFVATECVQSCQWEDDECKQRKPNDDANSASTAPMDTT